jgi:hypothetical protein
VSEHACTPHFGGYACSFQKACWICVANLRQEARLAGCFAPPKKLNDITDLCFYSSKLQNNYETSDFDFAK